MGVSTTQASTTCASLPWYDFPATAGALDAVWRVVVMALKAAGIDYAPDSLDRVTPHRSQLQDPGLVLSQCCGPELFLKHTLQVVPIAAPVFSAYDVAPGYYFSHIVAGEGATLEKPRVAVNDLASYSGHMAVKHWLAANVADYSIHVTGSHAQSVRDIQAGDADVAAIDALSWLYLDTDGVSILADSRPVLAPPFVTSCHNGIPNEVLAQALSVAFAQSGQPVGIADVLPVARDDYLAFCK